MLALLLHCVRRTVRHGAEQLHDMLPEAAVMGVNALARLEVAENGRQAAAGGAGDTCTGE